MRQDAIDLLLHYFYNKNVMARPHKDEQLLMKESIRIMLTDEQKNLIEKAAKLGHSDVSTWVRPILMQAAQEAIDQHKAARPAKK